VSPTDLLQPATSSNSIRVVDPEFQSPLTHGWAITYQRQIWGRTMLEIGYVGRRAQHLFGAYNVDQADYTTNGFLDAFVAAKSGGESALLDRLLARPERAGRPLRKVAVSARLVGGGSWRRTATLREASADRSRLRAALGTKLAEIPAPVVELRLEAVELADRVGDQLALVEPRGLGGHGSDELDQRLREGLRQVRASTGTGSICAVVEMAPWSRIPETRALVVPRDD